MHVVTFYQTTSSGQKELGKVKYNGKKVTGSQDLAGIFEGAEGAQLIQAMRDAPKRFDGPYLRASYEEVE